MTALSEAPISRPDARLESLARGFDSIGLGARLRRLAEAARETEWTKPSFGKELFLGRLRLVGVGR